MSLLGYLETGKPLLQNFTNEEVPLCATFVPLGAKILSQLLKVVETPFGLKMTAIPEFILALITTLSSRTFRFRVNREKLFLTEN